MRLQNQMLRLLNRVHYSVNSSRSLYSSVYRTMSSEASSTATPVAETLFGKYMGGGGTYLQPEILFFSNPSGTGYTNLLYSLVRYLLRFYKYCLPVKFYR